MQRFNSNPFYVQPGGDLTQGLAGLGDVLQQNRAMKEQKAAEEARQQRIAQAQQAARQALQSGDPMMVAEVAMQYPEIAEMMNKQAGIVDEQKQKDATNFYTALLTAPADKRGQIYQQRIDMLSKQGRDPSNTMQSYRDYLADPETEARQVEAMFAGTNPTAYKAYREATQVKPPETRELKRGDRIVTQQFNERTGQYEDIAEAGRFNPNAGTRVDVSVSNGSDKFVEEVAKGDASRFQEAAAAGQQAGRSRVRIDELENLLDKSGGGFLTNAQAIAGNFGIPTEGLDDVQAAQALINSLVPEQRPPGSGPMSDADLELFKQSLPRLINSPDGNRKIINTIRAINDYDRRIGDIANKAMAGEISRNEARDRMMRVTNPLADFSPDGEPSDSGAPEGVDPEAWKFMTPEQKALWN